MNREGNRTRTSRPGSFQMNAATGDIRSSVGQGYAFKRNSLAAKTTPTSNTSDGHVPFYSLPPKEAPTTHKPRAQDVFYGTTTTNNASSARVNTTSQNSTASPLAEPHVWPSSSAGQRVTRQIASPYVNGGDPGTSDDLHTKHYNGDHHTMTHYAEIDEPYPDRYSDAHQRVVINGSEIYGATEAESSSIYEEDDSGESVLYGTKPADFDMLVEASKWKKGDDDGRITSKHGTIRGVNNMVRASIEAFTSQDLLDGKKRSLPDERGLLVIYTTSVSAVRRRYDNCVRALHILYTHQVAFEARDVFISREHMEELRQRLGVPDDVQDISVPHVFISGIYLGGIDELDRMNESGELKTIFAPLEKVSEKPLCERCFGHRYVICAGCNGSRKSKSFYRTANVFAILRCAQCDENGMVPCEVCNPNYKPSARQAAINTATSQSVSN